MDGSHSKARQRDPNGGRRLRAGRHCFIGHRGASLFGAQGSIVGTVIGSLIMSTLRNAGNLLGIEPF